MRSRSRFKKEKHCTWCGDQHTCWNCREATRKYWASPEVTLMFENIANKMAEHILETSIEMKLLSAAVPPKSGKYYRIG